MTKYSELTEQEKEKRREACRRWKAKHGRDYRAAEAKRQPRIEKRMLASAKWRANSSGIPFAIEAQDIVIANNCPICNCEMLSAKGVRGGSSQSPTLDRIFSDNGYVKGNIAVICKGCNSQKGNSTAAQLRRIADWIENNS